MASLVRFQGFGLASVADVVAQLISKGKAREVGQVSTLPPGIPEVSLDDLKSRFDPWYKKWWIWAIAGTVAAGGTYFLIRRKKTK